MSKAQEAVKGLKAMRYTYDGMRALGIQADNSKLSRIYKHAIPVDQPLENALVKLHNSLCKRGEKIK